MAVGEFASLQQQAQLCSVPERDAIVQLLPAAKPNLVVHREHVQGKSWSRSNDGNISMETVAEARTKLPTESVYCPDCQMWCNGMTQWLGHLQQKKHRKSVRHWRIHNTSAGSGV